MEGVSFIPGFDPLAGRGNANSCLFQAFNGTGCFNYDAESMGDLDSTNHTLVVHSFGFFAFLVARSRGRFENVRHLVVLDGWFPSIDNHDERFGFKIELPPISTLFVFPTVGDRSDFGLESVVRQAMATGRRDLTIVRALGFGHNLLYENFGIPEVRTLVRNLVTDFPSATGKDRTITFPNTNGDWVGSSASVYNPAGLPPRPHA